MHGETFILAIMNGASLRPLGKLVRFANATSSNKYSRELRKSFFILYSQIQVRATRHDISIILSETNTPIATSPDMAQQTNIHILIMSSRLAPAKQTREDEVHGRSSSYANRRFNARHDGSMG